MATKTRRWMIPATALVLALGAAQSIPSSMAQNTQNDSQIQVQLTKSLNNNRFKDVSASVQGGVVSLAGTVDVYAAKVDAEKKAHKLKSVSAVRDDIQVGGPAVEDQVLQNKLMRKIQTDRIGYGTTAFNAITVNVDNGVATLAGLACRPMDKQYALGDASYMPGVKDVVDNIQVAPLSMMDDRVRYDTARAVYGYPSLLKYAVDPVKPIRILVVNGNVTLVGTVLNQADKNVAGIRANGVFGAFKVTNDLQVANQQTERN
jgi:hyperosmotically inducible periplasmic protein